MEIRYRCAGLALATSLILAGYGGSQTRAAARSQAAPSCTALKAHGGLAGKALHIGTDPVSPGYESAAADNPGQIVGLDPDLIGALASCLGFTYSFQSFDFSALVAALEARRIDLIASGMYATPARAARVNFVLYMKAATGTVVRKGNPHHLNALAALCGVTAAVPNGTVEQALLTQQSAKCAASGKGAITVATYQDNAACLQAVRNGRADIFLTDAGLAASLARAYPASVQTAFTISTGFTIGLGVNKGDRALLTAIRDGMAALQAQGIESHLLKKWGFAAAQLESARIVTR